MKLNGKKVLKFLKLLTNNHLILTNLLNKQLKLMKSPLFNQKRRSQFSQLKFVM